MKKIMKKRLKKDYEKKIKKIKIKKIKNRFERTFFLFLFKQQFVLHQ